MIKSRLAMPGLGRLAMNTNTKRNKLRDENILNTSLIKEKRMDLFRCRTSNMHKRQKKTIM